MTYDYTVFIGRFQPPHAGHLNVVKTALQKSKRVIIGIGSANRSRRTDNLFTYEERVALWNSMLGPDDKVSYVSLDDKDYLDNAWVFQTRHRINNMIRYFGDNPDDVTIALTGHEKDRTSYYLKYFPEWVESFVSEAYDNLASTQIREYLYNKYLEDPEILQTLDRNFGRAELRGLTTSDIWQPRFQEVFRELAPEWDFEKNYDPKKFDVIVQTVDAVVVCNGHVLVVRRKNRPGQGLLALPGGHLNPHEYLKDAMLRELREETKIDLSNKVLRANIDRNEYFDGPNRSNRARVITQAFRINLRTEETLPKVKGADDAAEAFWMPIDEVRYQDFFEDHASIIERMTSNL